MSKYAGTKTEQNLMEAFSGESQARNKYTLLCVCCKKSRICSDGDIFEETANQEKEHAKMWFKEFHGIGSVDENLADAAAGETMNGQICIREWLKRLKTKDFRSWPQSSAALPR